MTVTIDTADLPAADRDGWWRDAVSDQFVPMNVVPVGDDLHGRVAATGVGGVQLRRISASAHRFDRSPKLIRRTDEDYYKVAVGMAGSFLLVQDGRDTVIRPGELAMYDSTRPYVFVMDDDYDLTVCMVPKRLLPVRAVQLSAVTAIATDATTGIGALLVPFLADLFRHSSEVGADAQASLADSVARLIGGLVTDGTASSMPASAHVLRALAFIDQHIADPSLGPESVATAVGVSLSYLHRLFFDTDDTVAGSIRERRLQGCWNDLARGDLADLTIAAIGRRWGLTDPVRLSHVFRARFGTSPTEHRRAIRWTGPALAGAVTTAASRHGSPLVEVKR